MGLKTFGSLEADHSLNTVSDSTWLQVRIQLIGRVIHSLKDDLVALKTTNRSLVSDIIPKLSCHEGMHWKHVVLIWGMRLVDTNCSWNSRLVVASCSRTCLSRYSCLYVHVLCCVHPSRALWGVLLPRFLLSSFVLYPFTHLIRTPTHRHTHTRARTPTHPHTDVHTQTHTHIHTHTHTHTHIRTHTHTHALAHTHTCLLYTSPSPRD